MTKLEGLFSFAIALPLAASCAREVEPEPTPDAPGFRQLNESVFQVQCATQACHSGPGIAGLSFDDTEAAYEHLIDGEPVNAPAHADALRLVVPGDPDKSFLLTKLTMSQAELGIHAYGAAMPMAATQIPGPSSLQAIRDWIDAGAPLDGGPVTADLQPAPSDGYIDCDATTEAEMQACFGEAPDPSVALRLFTKPMVIPPGVEVEICNYLEVTTSEQLLFKEVRGAQFRGGHHAAVFVSIAPDSDFPSEPCDDDMSDLRYVGGAGGAAGKFTSLPTGVALHVEPGNQFVIQSHYINTSDEPITVMDMVDLYYTDSAESPTLIDPMAIIYDDIAVPVGATGHSSTTECVLEEDLDVYMMLGHTHESGVLLEFERVPAGQTQAELLYRGTDGKLMRENPEIKIYEDPLQFSAGDLLRLTCSWDNTTDEVLGWPQEMCVALMYYGPGEGWMVCNQDDGSPTLLGGDGVGCVPEDAPGNDQGVGEACTTDGNECADNTAATACLAQFDAEANFCTFFNCTTDEECGEGATCEDRMGAMLCIPLSCQ